MFNEGFWLRLLAVAHFYLIRRMLRPVLSGSRDKFVYETGEAGTAFVGQVCAIDEKPFALVGLPFEHVGDVDERQVEANAQLAYRATEAQAESAVPEFVELGRSSPRELVECIEQSSFRLMLDTLRPGGKRLQSVRKSDAHRAADCHPVLKVALDLGHGDLNAIAPV